MESIDGFGAVKGKHKEDNCQKNRASLLSEQELKITFLSCESVTCVKEVMEYGQFPVQRCKC